MEQIKPSIIQLMCVAAMALTLTACSTTKEPIYVGDIEVQDPFEDSNRIMLNINEGIDKVVLEPVARGYRAATPRAFRYALGNFLTNLRSPITIGNQLLQGDLEGAANATARMVINTLAGFGGILDLAADGGIEHEIEDFGQTLAVWGVGDGPYFVVPLLGPSTLRDGTGMAVDSFLDPVRIYLFNTDHERLNYVRMGASIIDQREELLDVIDDLRRNSFDYYAALRSAYIQRRAALINDQDPDTVAGPMIPDYE